MKFSLLNVCRVGLVSSVLTLMACTGSGGRGVGGTGLVISGQLGGTSLMSLNKMSQKTSDVTAQDMNAFSGFDDLEIVATAATEPPTTATGSVDAQGNFSVDLGSGAAGTAITVTFVDENTDAVVGEVKFTDSSTTDLNGNPKADSAVVATGSMDLGSIVLAEDGTISVPKTAVPAIQDVAVDASTAFNPTGEWAMGAYDKTLPAGFQTVGAPDPQDPGSPHIGFKLTLARFAGKEFTPSGSNCQKDASGTITSCPVTSGTVGSEDRYALSIWGGDYSQSFGACGGTTGFTADEARGYGRIHIASGTLPTIGVSGTIAFGAYAFDSAPGGTGAAPYDQHWMVAAASATAMHDDYDCRPISVSGTTKMLSAWACKSQSVSSATVGWQVGLQGSGCRNADTDKPVNVTNWAAMSTCTNHQTASSTEFAGFRTDNCTYLNVDPDGVSGTATAMNIICAHTGGQFADSSGNPNLSSPLNLADGDHLGQPTKLIGVGDFCHTAGSSSTARVLAGYRCYANAYWKNRGEGAGGVSCPREYNFNWQASKPEDFVRRDDFKGRPKNAFITNILNYAADGKSAVLEDEETENITIQGSSDSNTFCRVVRRTQLSFKSISTTKIVVELRESGRMASTDAACIAAANAAKLANEQEGGELKHMIEPWNMIFYLNKL
ncbi:MAG: hypothetical protein NDI63_06485 [Pseudobdellovibrio sp.]|nr:hypothetical protein [Pseudobdellovibrio sp.]